MMRKITDLPLEILLHIGEFLNKYADDEYGYLRASYDERSYFAAVINEFEMLQHYLERCSDDCGQVRMKTGVVMAGNLNAVKYLHEYGCPWDEEACLRAAMEILQYLHENGCPWNAWACIEAADEGHMEILKYLLENGCPWDVLVSREAALAGSMEILKYLVRNGCPIDP